MSDEDDAKEKKREYARRWREANREKTREASRRYGNAHPERLRERGRRWREANREKLREGYRQRYEENKGKGINYSQQWYQENKGRLAEVKQKWRDENKDKQAGYLRRWRENNRDRARAQDRKYRVLKAGAGGSHTEEEWKALVAHYGGCIHPDKDKCNGMITEDHIIPISEGGSDDIDNIQPLCQHHNFSKHTKTIDYRPDRNQLSN